MKSEKTNSRGAARAGLTKYAPTGELLWSAQVPFAVDFALDASGYAYVTVGRGGGGVTTRKYGPAGEQIWSVDHPGNVSAGALAVDAFGGVYVAIQHTQEAPPPPGAPPCAAPGGCYGYEMTAITTVKYAAGGTQEWLATHQFAEPRHAGHVTGIAVSADGSVFVFGGDVAIKYAQAEY